MAILDFVKGERQWLLDHPPADCYAAAHGAGMAMLDAYQAAAADFVDWARGKRAVRALVALAKAGDAANAATDAFAAFGTAIDEHAVPGLMPDAARRPPTRHVTSRRIVAVRGESLEVRDDRVVGEAPLEIRAAGPAPGPGRGRGHDADARLRGASWRSGSCGPRA